MSEATAPTPPPDHSPWPDCEQRYVTPVTAEADAQQQAGGRAVITPYRDGPLIVRGDFDLRTQDGQIIDPGRATVALCRCGHSAVKPFCDGTHKKARFQAPG